MYQCIYQLEETKIFHAQYSDLPWNSNETRSRQSKYRIFCRIIGLGIHLLSVNVYFYYTVALSLSAVMMTAEKLSKYIERNVKCVL